MDSARDFHPPSARLSASSLFSTEVALKSKYRPHIVFRADECQLPFNFRSEGLGPAGRLIE